MKIKKILQSRKYVDLYVVVLEDESSFYVTAEGLFHFKMKKALDINPTIIKKLKDESTFNLYLYKTKLKILTKKYSEYQIKTYLQRSLLKDPKIDNTKSKQVIDKVISYLKDNSFIDDNSYAIRKIELLNRSNRNLGINRIKDKLYKDGIDEKIIKDLIESIDPNEELKKAKYETEKFANQLLRSTFRFQEKRGVEFKNVRNRDEIKLIKLKAYRHLLYKGFSFNNAKIAVDTTFDQFYNDSSKNIE